MAQYGHEVYGQFETLMAVDGDPAPIDFHREGYLGSLTRAAEPRAGVRQPPKKEPAGSRWDLADYGDLTSERV